MTHRSDGAGKEEAGEKIIVECNEEIQAIRVISFGRRQYLI
jgi:hypothetical protein